MCLDICQTLFSNAFPTGIRPQGKEIVRTWLYYTLLKSALLLDSPAFKHIWIDGLGMDPWVRKMAKSLGNVIAANSVLEGGAGGRTGSWKVRGPDKVVNLRANKIGSECFRLWLDTVPKSEMTSKLTLKKLNKILWSSYKIIQCSKVFKPISRA